jgi:hypothetical protein
MEVARLSRNSMNRRRRRVAPPDNVQRGDRILVRDLFSGRSGDAETRASVLDYTVRIFGQKAGSTQKTPYRAEIELSFLRPSPDDLSKGYIRFFEPGNALPADGPFEVGAYVMNVPIDRLADIVATLRESANIYFGPCSQFDSRAKLEAGGRTGRSPGASTVSPAYQYKLLGLSNTALDPFPDIDAATVYMNGWASDGWEFLNASVTYRGGKYFLAPTGRSDDAILLRRIKPS